MIVEDDRDLRLALDAGLAEERYRVVACESAELALAETSIADPELIVLDLHLPGMAGLEFLRQYRARGGRAKVLITGEQFVRPFGVGREEWIAKPFGLDELLVRVATAIGRAA